MYTKKQAFTALTNLKIRYNELLTAVSEVEDLVAIDEQYLADSPTERSVIKTWGNIKAGFFALNMLWGFLSVVPLCIFAGLFVISIFRTNYQLYRFDKADDDFIKKLGEIKDELKDVKDQIKIIEKNIDCLHDVVYQNKPITKQEEKIIDENLTPTFLEDEQKIVYSTENENNYQYTNELSK